MTTENSVIINATWQNFAWSIFALSILFPELRVRDLNQVLPLIRHEKQKDISDAYTLITAGTYQAKDCVNHNTFTKAEAAAKGFHQNCHWRWLVEVTILNVKLNSTDSSLAAGCFSKPFTFEDLISKSPYCWLLMFVWRIWYWINL